MHTLQHYSAMCVAAWAYITAAGCMGVTAGLFVDRKDWALPTALVGPLFYWIFICSVLGYWVVTYSTQHLPASQVTNPRPSPPHPTPPHPTPPHPTPPHPTPWGGHLGAFCGLHSSNVRGGTCLPQALSH